MRHHRLQPRAWLVPLAVAFGVASCAETVGIGSYTVTYRAKTTGVATIDSILYSPGTGKCTTICNADSSLTKVSNPSVTFSTELVVPSGSVVEAHLYGKGTAAGTAQMTAIWMTANGGIAGDSSTATTAVGTAFTINIAHRVLTK